MRGLLALMFLAGLIACGESTGPPSAAETGTLLFSVVRCDAYATAEFHIGGEKVGEEPIVAGVVSKSFSASAGKPTATQVRALKAGETLGLWTTNRRVTVPANGSVTVEHACGG